MRIRALKLRRIARWAAVGAVCFALPPPALHAALANTGGLLFEAAPFVLGSSLLASLFENRRFAGRVGRTAAFWTQTIGCGCGRFPGALALPAVALCWVAFGPPIALLRAGFALLLLSALRWRQTSSVRPNDRAAFENFRDPLAELAAICEAGAATMLLKAILSVGWLPTMGSGPLTDAISFVGGLVLGAWYPCTTGAVASAVALRTTAPAFSTGLLCSAGLMALGTHAAPRTCAVQVATSCGTRLGYVMVSAACAMLALAGPAGLVHPRLLPLIWCAIPVAVSFALRKDTRDHGNRAVGLRVPAIMFGAIIFGSPAPPAAGSASTPVDLYPGAQLVFTGSVASNASTTKLVRYEITCCRADAEPLALRIVPRLNPPGSWWTVEGTVAVDARGPYLQTARAKRIAAPRDPFIYR